ncbi:MAG: hypothetical protein C5B51_01220 [Terriglobia bacterium]|nr:MAG: hypothetical protein C5B51_01220 [Terriglobia bacterium]
MNLIDVTKKFGTAEAANDFLERMRWPEGVRCVKCDGTKVSKYVKQASTRMRFSAKTGYVEKPVPARILYVCRECKRQFSVTEGTIFNDTHLPLQKWFMATALMVNAKKGLSAKQMERDVEVTYKTAWYLCHRIREAMENENGVFGGTVEMDETFMGGRYDERRKRARYAKQPVMGVIQRGTEEEHSKVHAFPIPHVRREVIADVVKNYVAPEAQIYTDEGGGYRHLKDKHNHAIVIHSKGEYVRGEVHTNSIEGFWSLVKRQIIGQHHFVSVKHLQRYLNEVSFKFNNREAESLFLLVIIRLLIGSALKYKTLIATEAPQQRLLSIKDAAEEPF